jgi:hypothetical protein
MNESNLKVVLHVYCVLREKRSHVYTEMWENIWASKIQYREIAVSGQSGYKTGPNKISLTLRYFRDNC